MPKRTPEKNRKKVINEAKKKQYFFFFFNNHKKKFIKIFRWTAIELVNQETKRFIESKQRIKCFDELGLAIDWP